ncbi:MAG: SIMPL domain-containing protein [Flavobacterium sp.]|nr:SIMPL domain-containing protein [Flavobacterium sp.]
MKNLFITILILFFTKSISQNKNFIDQAYLETEIEIDSLIVPDRIYLTIILNETDSRNKKSTEDLENLMNNTLKSLNINTEKSLTLLDFSSDFKKYFLSGQNVLKTKMYSLLVNDAFTAGKVLAELEKVDISNVSIEKTEYSKSEELLLDLKSKAIIKSKRYAESMTKPLNQKVGKAIFISDLNSISNQLQGRVSGVQIRGASSVYGNRTNEPIAVEFNKIKFTTKISIKYLIE